MEEDPAWMVCEDIVSRIEAELMSEALDLLHGEIDAGRIKVDGNMVTASELTGEAERDLFILNKLLEDEQTMRSRYENLVKTVEEGSEVNPEIVGRIEEVKKFLLVVSQISMTMKYARVFKGWFEDAGKHMKVKDPSQIIYMTASQSEERKEALGFVLSNKTFIKNEALNQNELGIVKSAYARFSSPDKHS